MVKIIIVDNSEIFRSALFDFLSKNESYQIFIDTSNGLELFSKIKSKTPDIIIIDLDQPIINVYDTAAKIKNQNPEIKIIAFTLKDENILREKVISSGFDGLIHKVDMEIMMKSAIKSVLKNKAFFPKTIF